MAYTLPPLPYSNDALEPSIDATIVFATVFVASDAPTCPDTPPPSPPAPDAAQSSRMFGGQLLAQALAAASFTVPPEWTCHSLHAYFVRLGEC